MSLLCLSESISPPHPYPTIRIHSDVLSTPKAHTHTLTRPGFGELCRSNIKCYTSANVMTAINVSACGWGVGVWVVALPSISVSLACFYRSGRPVRCRMLPLLLCARTCAGRKFVTGQRKFPSSRVACMLARRTTRKKHFPASPRWHFPAFPIFLNTGGESLSFGRSGSMGKVGHTKMPYCLPALSVRLLLLYSCR